MNELAQCHAEPTRPEPSSRKWWKRHTMWRLQFTDTTRLQPVTGHFTGDRWDRTSYLPLSLSLSTLTGCKLWELSDSVCVHSHSMEHSQPLWRPLGACHRVRVRWATPSMSHPHTAVNLSQCTSSNCFYINRQPFSIRCTCINFHFSQMHHFPFTKAMLFIMLLFIKFIESTLNLT